MGNRILHLLRHGQYVREPERLTPLGIAQAECLAARIGQEPVEIIHSSPSPRAQETADIVGAALPKAPKRRSSVLSEGIPCLPRWKKVPERLAAVLGDRQPEDWEREALRIQRATEQFVKPTRGADRVEVMVFHGNWIRAMVCLALDMPIAAWWDLDIIHCSLTTIEVRPYRTVLRCFNDTGHLPRRFRTFE
jgi:broad specificity phosphatase PhoE